MPQPAELQSSADSYFDRAGEGRQLAEGIAAAAGNVVVIHGRLGCGKTLLLRKWVIPRLKENHEVYFGDCTPDLPETVYGQEGELDLVEALGRKCILFLDGFDRFLLRGVRGRREGLDKLFTRGTAKLVLVVNDPNLGELLGLRAQVPAIMETLLEVAEVPLGEGLDRLGAASGSGRTYAPEMIIALKAELEQFSPKNRSVRPDLLKVIDSQAERILGPGSGLVFGLSEFKDNGGLSGLLEADLGQHVLAVRGEVLTATAELTIGILEDMVEARNATMAYTPIDTAHRIGADPDICRKAFAWLTDRSGLVREGWGGQLELAPIQFEHVLEESVEARHRKSRRAEGILRNGLIHWRESGALLHEQLFGEVQSSRTTLRASEEECSFLVHCALVVDHNEDLQAARYWLARIQDPSEKVAALLEALFDKQARVRARAVLLLKTFGEPEVCSQLYRVALEDPDEAVRQQAVASLDAMEVAGFWKMLAQEARQASSPFQQAAIAALRIFKDGRTAQLLKELVNDPANTPPIRVAAIGTLAAIEVSESARALVDIALSDPDYDDRQLAAKSLASTRSKELAKETIAALREDQPAAMQSVSRGGMGTVLWILGIGSLACLAATLSVAIHLLLLVRFATPGAWPVPAFLALAAGCLIPTAILVRKRSRLQVRLRTAQGLLTTTAFAASVPILLVLPHGLLHMMVKRVRSGLVILWAEILGLICISLPTLDDRYFQIFDTPQLGGFYLAVGSILVIGSWIWDVGAVGYNDVCFPLRRLARQRRDATLKQVLTNPHAAEFVLNQAQCDDHRESRWARSVVKNLGESIPPQLWVDLLKQRGIAIAPFAIRRLQRTHSEETIRAVLGLWPEANPAMRGRLVSILAGHPSQVSLDVLSRIPDLGWWAKVRYAWGLCQFRLGLIPNAMWLSALLLLPMPVIIMRELVPIVMDPPTLLVKIVNPKAALQKPDFVVKTAKFVVDAIPEKATPRMVEVVGGIAGESIEWGTRLEAIGFLTSLASRAELPDLSSEARKAISRQIPSLLGMLNTPAKIEEKLQILRALEAAANSEAVTALKELVLRLGAQIQPDRVESRLALSLSNAEPRTLIMESLRILGRSPAKEAAPAIAELLAHGVPESVRAWALDEQRQPKARLLVERLRVEFDQGNYDQVVRTGLEAEPVLQGRANAKELVEALLIVGRAKQQLSSFNSNSKKSEDLDEETIRFAQRARTIDPPNAEAAKLLASSYGRQAERRRSWKRFEDALALVNKALRADPRNPEMLATKGQIYLDLKRNVDALDSFAEATRISPGFTWAHAMQASIELEQKNYDRSLTHAERTIESDPSYAWGYTLLSESYHRQDKDREAVVRLTELRRSHPHSTWPARSLMFVYHENLSATDPLAYQRNHELYVELEAAFRGKIPEQADFDAGFVEAELTTGRYDAVLDRGEKLLETKPGQSISLAISLIMYAAAVLKNNSSVASVNLSRLEAEVKGLPNDFEPNWSYKGTRNYITKRKLAPDVERPLETLLSAMSGKSSDQRAEAIASNRKMLKNLK